MAIAAMKKRFLQTGVPLILQVRVLRIIQGPKAA